MKPLQLNPQDIALVMAYRQTDTRSQEHTLRFLQACVIDAAAKRRREVKPKLRLVAGGRVAA